MHHRVATTLTWGIAAVAVAITATTAVSTTTWGSDERLWEEAHLLSSRQRADMGKRLASAARRLGSPVFVLVTDTRRPETVADLAARTFSERALGGKSESNPVLLVLSVRERAAAIETGKGNAGIVPEIDATQITKRLVRELSRGGPTEALTRAIDEIVASAQATAARRRPLPPEEDLRARDARLPATAGGRQSAADDDADADAGSGGTADASSLALGAVPVGTPPEKPRGRSRLPIAVGIAALLLLALALRRRRQLTALRKERDDRDAPAAPMRADPKPGPKPPRR